VEYPQGSSFHDELETYTNQNFWSHTMRSCSAPWLHC